MSYFKTLGIAIDQLGMALCGGNEDCTISATVGFYARYTDEKYWKVLEWVINATFYPVDGKGHCLQAFDKEVDEEYKEGYKMPLAVITFVFCIPIAVILWSNYLIKKLW